MASSRPQLYDAFFWIEPVSNPTNHKFTNEKVLWSHPSDVSAVIKNFGSIPKFCFPDLNDLKITRVEEGKYEFFTFTLTDSEGQRMFGICLRAMFRGEKGRFDVRRRACHCLCFMTRTPYFSLFKSILMEVHALCLIGKDPSRAYNFLDLVYQQANQALSNSTIVNSLNITVSKTTFHDVSQDFVLSTPRYIGMKVSNKEVNLLPLLEVFGVDNFLLLLGAILCERRVLFIATEVHKLSTFVLAAASMISPFTWQHVFIPILPATLLDYAYAPMPYIIGVKKNISNNLNRDALGEVLKVDIDSGKITLEGGVAVPNFIGESNTTLKQATESFDRVRAKASEMAKFMGVSKITGNSSSESEYSGPRDIVASVISDLKAVMTNKPGSNSIQSMASGLLRTLPGTGKSNEELKVQWSIESEKSLRDTIMYFFVYLFASLDENMVRNADVSGAMRGGSKPATGAFSKSDSRSFFNTKNFINKRVSMGDSNHLLDFVNELMQSQMFERFCDERYKALNSSMSSQPKSGMSFGRDTEEIDLYDVSCAELRNRQVQHNVATVKQVVVSQSLCGNEGGVDKLGNEFHPLTFRFTGGMVQGSEDWNDTSAATNANNGFVSSNSFEAMCERICNESFQSNNFLRILRTIEIRLRSCLASVGRGNSGASGIRSLHLLKHCLLRGPEATLSYAISLIPLLRKLAQINQKQSSSSATQALEYMSLGQSYDVKSPALAALNLVIDHRKLKVRRRYLFLKSRGLFASTRPDAAFKCKKEKFPLIDSLSNIKKFSDVHQMLQPANVPVFSGKFNLHVSKAINQEDDGDDVADVDPSDNNVVVSGTSNKFSSGQSNSSTAATRISAPVTSVPESRAAVAAKSSVVHDLLDLDTHSNSPRVASESVPTNGIASNTGFPQDSNSGKKTAVPVLTPPPVSAAPRSAVKAATKSGFDSDPFATTNKSNTTGFSEFDTNKSNSSNNSGSRFSGFENFSTDPFGFPSAPAAPAVSSSSSAFPPADPFAKSDPFAAPARDSFARPVVNDIFGVSDAFSKPSAPINPFTSFGNTGAAPMTSNNNSMNSMNNMNNMNNMNRNFVGMNSAQMPMNTPSMNFNGMMGSPVGIAPSGNNNNMNSMNSMNGNNMMARNNMSGKTNNNKPQDPFADLVTMKK